MDREQLKLAARTIDQAAQEGSLTVVRQGLDVLPSKQAKYTEPDGAHSLDFIFQSVMRWKDEVVPEYKPDSRERDRWLLNFVPNEPHLHGVLQTACSLVANRGWHITGDLDLVMSVRDVIHSADKDEGNRFGRGWRHFIRNAARSFYATDINFIGEIGRPPSPPDVVGPMNAIWSTDPARFRLTGDPRGPLEYFPSRRVKHVEGIESNGSLSVLTTLGSRQVWKDIDYFRVVNNPSLDEIYHDLGFCAISSVIELAKIMIAVYEYDKERLGARAPKGLLLLRNISQRQWEQAMSARETRLDAKNQQYYGGVAVLASLGSADIDAKLLALSELPENFDRQQFITLLMYAYSLTFGFAPDEFWPVQIGWLLGRNTEAELGLERATQKGDADFFLAFQDRFQQELPSFGTNEPAVLFTFEQRNDRGRALAADVAQTWARTAERLYGTGLQYGTPLMSQEQVLQLLVDQDIVPAEITDIKEETQADDTHSVRERELVRNKPGIIRMAQYFPSRPIVMYRWPTDDVVILYDRADDILRPKVWRKPLKLEGVKTIDGEYTGQDHKATTV